MCGIVGFCEIARPPDTYPALLQRMLSYIAHRGQDEYGYWFDERSGFGTARLSIIDLVSGQQPFTDPGGRYCLVFNGEIFNYIELRRELEMRGYIFTSRSDTEVLLYALIHWDTEALQRLNGQFAFAFYDRKRRRMVIARDPFGERPLFYMRIGHGVAFASEVKGLFALPDVSRTLDRTSIEDAFYGWTNLSANTSFLDVRSLPHGCWLDINEGIPGQPCCYYRLQWNEPPEITDLARLSELVAEKLEHSASIRLRSDVPVGTYLSGGLDSTIVTYLAQRLSNHQIRTFSVAFEDENFDEARYQTESAKILETQHTAISVNAAHIVEHFESVIWHSETVQFRTALVPLFLLSKVVRDSGIKVVLTGEGADEAFLGYDIFKELLFRERFDTYSNDAARLDAVIQLYQYLPHFNRRNAGMLVSFYGKFLKERITGLFSHETRFANGAHAIRLLQDHAEDSVIAKRILHAASEHYPGFSDYSPIKRAQILEYDSLLAGYLLSSQGDRMTSAHTIEGRCPFLDRELVDFANTLPMEFRLKDGVNEKYILKEAFKSKIPDTIRLRPKQPYRAPAASCFLESRAGWVDDALSRESFQACGVIDIAHAERFVAKLRTMRAEQISPRDDQAFILLLSLVLLHRNFIADFRPPVNDVTSRLIRMVDARSDRVRE